MPEPREFIAIEFGEQLFAIDIRLVREISRSKGLTRVPRAPHYIRGLANLRGQVVLVLDLSVLLGRASAALRNESDLVVLKTVAELRTVRSGDDSGLDIDTGDKPIGLIVDRVVDVLRIAENAVQPVPPHLPVENDQAFEGVASYGDDLYLILSIKELIARSLSATGEGGTKRARTEESQHGNTGP